MKCSHLLGAVLCCLSWQVDAGTPLTLEGVKTRVCGAGAEPQRLGCRYQIETLDRKLNVAFREAMRVVRNRDELRDTQRRWLVDVRDACEQSSCFDHALIARIVELQIAEIEARGRAETPMTDSEERTICEEVATLDSKGELNERLIAPREMPHSDASEAAFNASADSHDLFQAPDKFFALRIRRNQDVFFGQAFDGGTCASYTLFPVTPPKLRPNEEWPSDEIDPEEAEGDLHLIGWGAKESLLELRGRYFVVTGSYPDTGVQLVEWITPAAKRRPICTFALDHVDRQVVVSRSNAKLCTMAAANELPTVLVDDDAPVDIDDDGKPDNLVMQGVDSGAGCGHSERWFDVVDPATQKPRGDALSAALPSIAKYNSPTVNLYKYEGEYYLDGQMNDAPGLFKPDRGTVKVECVFRDQPVRRVEKIYPLDGVVRNPPKASNMQSEPVRR